MYTPSKISPRREGVYTETARVGRAGPSGVTLGYDPIVTFVTWYCETDTSANRSRAHASDPTARRFPKLRETCMP